MRNGSTLIEIHGALKNNWGGGNDYVYRDTCEGQLGVRWVGYAVPDFRPPGDRRWGENYNVANVPPDAFTRFIETLLTGGDAAVSQLNAQYDAEMRAHPGPNRSASYWVHG